MKHIYSYHPTVIAPNPRLVRHDVERGRDPRFLTRREGMFGEVVRVADLDVSGAHYFTTPEGAILAWIARAEAAIADPKYKSPARRADLEHWWEAIAIAQQDLGKLQKGTDDSALQREPSARGGVADKPRARRARRTGTRR